MRHMTEVHDIVQETGIKTIPTEKKCKKAKWLSEEALKIAVKRRQVKSPSSSMAKRERVGDFLGSRPGTWSNHFRQQATSWELRSSKMIIVFASESPQMPLASHPFKFFVTWFFFSWGNRDPKSISYTQLITQLISSSSVWPRGSCPFLLLSISV